MARVESGRWTDHRHSNPPIIHQCRIDSILIGGNSHKHMDSPGNRFFVRATLADVIQLDKDLWKAVYIYCQELPEVQWVPNCNLNPVSNALDQKFVSKKFDILGVD